mmetsp:Transcript_4053/g.13318  ORF Transcript_4053/g.13318 Transcript_4053/m.13318 type:complete len:209 (-) Transcript_4053:1970-2596(-)
MPSFFRPFLGGGSRRAVVPADRRHAAGVDDDGRGRVGGGGRRGAARGRRDGASDERGGPRGPGVRLSLRRRQGRGAGAGSGGPVALEEGGLFFKRKGRVPRGQGHRLRYGRPRVEVEGRDVLDEDGLRRRGGGAVGLRGRRRVRRLRPLHVAPLRAVRGGERHRAQGFSARRHPDVLLGEDGRSEQYRRRGPPRPRGRRRPLHQARGF